MRSAAITVLFLTSLSGLARGLPLLSVKVVDPSGAGLAQAYVVVRKVDPWGEVGRGVTTKDGLGPRVAVAPGLYQVIVTFPYSDWYGKDQQGNLYSSAVHEVIIGTKPVQLRVTLWPVLIDRFVRGGVVLRVQAILKSGLPAAGALILARNPKATFDTVSRAGPDGTAQVGVQAGNLVIVVALDNKIATREVCVNYINSGRNKRCLSVGPMGNIGKIVTVQLE